MTVKSRRFLALILALCSFLGIFIATQSIWKSTSEIVVFQNGDADIYLGQFFKPQKVFKVEFSKGISGAGDIILKRNDKDIKSVAEDEQYLFFKLVSGDSICQQNSCQIIEKDEFLVKKMGSDGWWSTRVAHIRSYESPIDRTFFLQSSKEIKVLFTNSDFLHFKIYNLKQGVNDISLNNLGDYNEWRIIYAGLFAFCCTGLFYLIYKFWGKITAIFYNVPAYSIFLAIILSIEYAAVFPGIFTSDTVVKNLSENDFSVWFSPIYMDFNRLIYSLYPNFIQLPEVIIFYIASVFLANSLKKVNYGKIIIAYLLVVQIVMPIFFVSIFVQQRIFLAIIVLYAAIIFAACNLFERGKISPVAYAFLIFSGLLRPEYWLIFLVFLAVDAWKRKNILQASLKPIFITLLGVFVISLLITYPGTWIQGVTSNNEKLKYQLVSLFDIAKPYVNCSNKEDVLSQAIEEGGGLQEYCSKSPEMFFWSKFRNDDVIKKVNNTMKHELINRMITNPEPAIKRIFLNIEKMTVQDYWQIYDKYSDQKKEISNPHIIDADKFGLMKSYTWQIKIHQFVIKIYKWLAIYLNVLISLFFVMVIVPVISRSWLTIVINSVFLLMMVAIGFAAPVAQWYYIVFIPLWSVLVIPIDALFYNSQKKWRLIIN